MSFTRSDAVELLKKSAAKYNIPLTLENDGGNLVSEKNVIFDLVEENYRFIQRIEVKDDTAASICKIIFPYDLDFETVNWIIYHMHQKTNYFINLDKQNWTVSIGTEIKISSLEPTLLKKLFFFINALKAGNHHFNFTECFFKDPLLHAKIFYNSYISATEFGMDIETAVLKADRLVERKGISYFYAFNKARDMVEKKGARYFVEHLILRDLFFKNPDKYLNPDSTDVTGFYVRQFQTILDEYNIPRISDYNIITAETIECDSQRKSIHIRIPNAKPEYDSTDLFFANNREPFYYAIEIKHVGDGEGEVQYVLAGWDAEINRYDFGWFDSREDALAEFEKILNK